MGEIVLSFEKFKETILLENIMGSKENGNFINAKKIRLPESEIYPIILSHKSHLVTQSLGHSGLSKDEILKKINEDLETLKQPKQVICHFAKTRPYYIKDISEIDGISQKDMHDKMEKDYDCLIIRYVHKNYTLVTYPIPIKPNGEDITEVCLYINTYNPKAKYKVRDDWDTATDIRESDSFDESHIYIVDIYE